MSKCLLFYEAARTHTRIENLCIHFIINVNTQIQFVVTGVVGMKILSIVLYRFGFRMMKERERERCDIRNGNI